MGSTLYDEKVDMWAAGCIVAEMILGKPIFLASSEIELLFLIFGVLGTPKIEDYPEVARMKDLSPSYPRFQPKGLCFSGVPKETQSFLEMLLVVNPSRRMGVY